MMPALNKLHLNRFTILIMIILSMFLILRCIKDPDPSLLGNLPDSKQIKGTISGTVVDISGKGIAGVTVTVEGRIGSTYSLSNGNFTIPDIPAGTYNLFFKRYSYLDTSLKSISLQINQELEILDDIILRSSKAKLSGKVLDSLHNPVPGAGIVVTNQPYLTLSGSNGVFDFSELISGNVTIVASCKGIGWGESSVTLEPGQKGTVEIILNSKGGSVKGRVLDQNGNGIGGTVVIAMGGGVKDTTNTEGEYYLTNLPSTLPLKISAGPDYVISGLRVTEGGQLSGVDLEYNPDVTKNSLILVSQTIISAQQFPVELIGDLRDENNSSVNLGDIYQFVWDLNNDSVIDTVTTSPILVMIPENSWGEETVIKYGVITNYENHDTINGAVMKIQRVSSNPVVQAYTSKATVRTGERCTFIGKAISLDQSIIEYIWDFGDGTTWRRADTSDVNRSYSHSGIYNAKFTAVTEKSSASDSITITVNGIHRGVALSNLSLSGDIKLDKSFFTDTLDYFATVPFETDSVTLTVQALDSNSLIIINQDTLKSGISSGSISLVVGNNDVKIKLIALDGTTGTYTIHITRQKNTDADLTDIIVKEKTRLLDLHFNKDTVEYQLLTGDKAAKLEFTPVISDTNALVLTGTDTLAHGQAISLTLDSVENKITFEVIAADRVTKKVYSITVIRTEAVLSELSVRSGETQILTDFDSKKHEYDFSVPFVTENVTLQFHRNRNTDIVIVNEDTISQNLEEVSVSLNAGINNIIIKVLAAETNSESEYDLNIDRRLNDATLTRIQILSGNTNLLTNFNSDSAKYNINVSQDIQSVKVMTVSTDSSAIITIGSDTIYKDSSFLVDLHDSEKTVITISVISSDRTVTGVYSVTLNREAVIITGPDTINTIDILKILQNGNNLLTEFDKNQMSYQKHVPYTTKSITLVSLTTDTQAVALIGSDTLYNMTNYPINLAYGNNPVNLTVFAADRNKYRIYNLQIVRDRAPVPSLTALSVLADGTNQLLHFSDTAIYNIPVPNQTSTITIVPSVADSALIIAVNDTIDSGSSTDFQFTGSAMTITMQVIYPGADTGNTYTVNIVRQGNTNISSIVLTDISHSITSQPSRSGDVFRDTVPYVVSSISLKPSLIDTSAHFFVQETVEIPHDSSLNLALSVIGENSFPITVRAAKDSSSSQFTLIIVRQAGTNSVASQIGAGQNLLQPSFNTQVSDYSLVLSPEVDSITLSIASQDPYAKISVNSLTPRSSGDWKVAVSENDTIKIRVISPDLSDTSVYTMHISRTQYHITVSRVGGGGNVTHLGDTLVTAGDNLKIDFGGTADYELSSVTVDGKGQTPLPSEYTFTNVTRSHLVVATFSRILSSVSTLSDLQVISGGNNILTGFTSNELAYQKSVSYTTQSIIVQAIPNDSKSVMMIGTDTLHVGDQYLVNLSTGVNTIAVKVIPEDNSGDRIYTITIDRDDGSNTLASQIGVDQGTLSPAFSATVPAYSLVLPDGVTAIDLTINAQDAAATIFVNGASLVGGVAKTLTVAENDTITIRVTAQDQVHTSEYTIHISRTHYHVTVNRVGGGGNVTHLGDTLVTAGDNLTIDFGNTADYELSSVTVDGNNQTPLPTEYTFSNVTRSHSVVATFSKILSSVSTLSDLQVISGGNNILTGFTSNQFAYQQSVSYITQSIILQATPTNSHAIMMIGTDTLHAGDQYPVNLSIGVNNVSVTVIPEDNSGNRIYTITIDRDDGSNSLASQIGVDQRTLSPAFSATIPAYSLVLPDGVTAIDLTVTAQDAAAIILVNGAFVVGGVAENVTVAENDIITIRITSQDQVHASEYTIQISRTHYHVMVSRVGGGGDVTHLGDTLVTAGDNLTIDFANTADYELSGVTVDGNDQSPLPSAYTFTNISGSHSLVATFSLIPTYSLSVSGTAGGIITSNPTSYTLHSNDTVTISAEAGAGFYFTGWTEQGGAHVIHSDSLQTKAFLLSADGTITAHFAPKIIYVSTTGNDANDGKTWLTAKSTVQAAIEAVSLLSPGVSSPAQIWIAQGTYYPTLCTNANEPRTVTFTIPEYVKLYGGFSGTESSISNRSKITVSNNIHQMEHETVLSGDIDRNSILDNGNCYHVISGYNMSLNGLTITYGNSSDEVSNGGQGAGGGVYGSVDTLLYCQFISNQANRGGAVSLFGIPYIADCLFKNNSTFSEGIYHGSAGALEYSGQGITMSRCSFYNNTSDFWVGAVSIGLFYDQFPPVARISDCVFQGNSAPSKGVAEFGGDRVIVNRCKFINNSSTSGGAAIYAAIWSNVEFINTLFTGNTGVTGGAIFSEADTLKLTNSTFSGNTANLGGAVYLNSEGDAYPVTNCIFWNNTATTDDAGSDFEDQIYYAAGHEPSVKNSCIQSETGNPWGVTSDNNISTYPLFNNDFSIPSTSPCRNTGTTTGAPTDDITGASRDNQPDMGAFEYR